MNLNRVYPKRDVSPNNDATATCAFRVLTFVHLSSRHIDDSRVQQTLDGKNRECPVLCVCVCVSTEIRHGLMRSS
jgi:hypothetical protein